MLKKLRNILICNLAITIIATSFFVNKQATAQSQSIGLSAQSAILMEQETGRVIFEKDAHAHRKIASITKIMTAIIAVESGRMDEEVLITAEMLKTEGSSIFLQLGERIKLRDLVYGLMLRSGNDAAKAIAITVGGNEDSFVHLMNDKAVWLGMVDSAFTNPSGLDDGDKHYSSAFDMALLMQYAMKNAEFRKITGTKKYTAESIQEKTKMKRVWGNKNKLVTGYYKYATGGKTGFTKKAGRTLVSTASKNGMDLIAVTIDAADDWLDQKYMFESAFDRFELRNFASIGMVDGIKKDFYKNHLLIKSDLVYPVSTNEINKYHVEYRLVDPQPTWKDANHIPKIVGKVQLYQGDQLVASKPIFYVEKPLKAAFIKILGKTFLKFIGGPGHG